MTTTDPPAVTVCPTCKHRAEVACYVDDAGLLHPKELSRETLLAHRNCDLMWLLRELSRAAFHLSKVRVFNLKGGEDVC